MSNTNHDALGLAVAMIEDGRSFDEFEYKFQEHYASQSNLPAITYYNLADWVVNTYKPAILKDMEEVTAPCSEEKKEEQPKICKIIVKRRSISSSPLVTCIDDPIDGNDLHLRIHDGYVDILNTDGKRYLCHEKDVLTIICFPAKKEEKDG